MGLTILIHTMRTLLNVTKQLGRNLIPPDRGISCKPLSIEIPIQLVDLLNHIELIIAKFFIQVQALFKASPAYCGSLLFSLFPVLRPPTDTSRESSFGRTPKILQAWIGLLHL